MKTSPTPDALANFRRTQTSLEARGVARAAVIRALNELLEQLTSSDTAADDESLLKAVRDLAAQEGAEALLSIRRLREMRPFAKKRFDQAMLRLAAADRVTLHYHDFAHSLSAAERDLLVADDRGVFYVGAALRRPR